MNAVATDEKKPPELVDEHERHMAVSGLGAEVSRAADMFDIYTRMGGFMMRWHKHDQQHPTYQLIVKQRAELASLLAHMKPPEFN